MANSVNESAESVVGAKLSRTSVLSEARSECLGKRQSNDTVSDSAANLTRLQKLALPRKGLLEATLSQFEHCFNPDMVDRMKTKIVQQGGKQKNYSSRESLENQTSRGKLKSQRIYNDLQSRLRKAAFDTLAKRIIEKLPELIVQMDCINMEQVPQDVRLLNDRLFATVVQYLGKPKTEHDKKTFQQLSFGLTKFVESIIDNVRSEENKSSKHKGNSTISLPERVAPTGKAYMNHACGED